MIKLDYKSAKPLHEQISMEIKELIISGVLKADEQLPSVRELSVSLTVNPNTVQHAYKALETEGIIYSLRGKGNFVAKAEKMPKITDGLYDSLIMAVKELMFRGEKQETVENIIRNIYSERNESLD